ncbi:hypothetical protein CCAX7_50600 [Capsulimonas corticalis]|uniref:Uncharacterized protein n=1 Tax=Capsulimonas corticalis TaxID=2219043 RepID=A0A402CPP1_9BACT|nr:DUF6345 domain-containing protein [Capsulimonas corticalis]BDI33009.1 hypothetical protein CCAX7_50600 [Capsulimonas corticalis]
MQHRSLPQAHKIIGVAAVISCFGMIAAHAAPIGPGSTVLVPGTNSTVRPELAGTVIRDTNIPFQIVGPGGAIVASGTVQDRVVRETVSGSLDFYVHVTNDASSTANLILVTRSDFGPATTDVDWRNDGVGVNAPQVTWRSTMADTLGFVFSSPNSQVHPGADTRFAMIKTNARSYVLSGVTTIQAVFPTGAVAGTARVVTAAPSPITAAATYHIFQLAGPDLNSSLVNKFATLQKLTPSGANRDSRSQVFVDGDGSVRVISDLSDGRFVFEPNLALTTDKAPDPRGVVKNALSFLQQYELLPAVRTGVLLDGEVVTTATGAAAKAGDKPVGQDVMRTVNFFRQVDGLRVVGPYSLLSVDLGGKGAIGAVRTIRPINYDAMHVDWKPYSQAAGEFSRELGALIGLLRRSDPKVQYRLVNFDFVYLEQGLKYVQPVYRFQVEFRTGDGEASGQTFVIPASNASPEAINNTPINDNPVTEPVSTRASVASDFLNPSPNGGASTLDYGVYVVRGDNRFLQDAWGFHTNLDTSNAVSSILGFGWHQPVNFNQYYWDHPWLWENDPADGVADNSRYYVGQNHVVLYEGHGAPWLSTTYSNNGDLIDYRTLPGYGAHNGTNGKTAYVIWHTCDSIPAPGDAYGNFYQSPAGPFDVWFNVFQGLRGTYGARTTVGIYNNAGPSFAWLAGLGIPNLNAWFSANTSAGHSGGWNYASAVILSGHENDRIYDNAAGPSAGSLTMWWQHP